MPLMLRLKQRVYRVLHPSRPPPRRQHLLEQLPRGGVGAEIGVWKGDFSARILEVARPVRLHLIDPWQAVAGEEYERARYGGKLAEGQAEMDAVYAGVLERFGRERARGVVVVHRTASLEAAGRFGDGELDFVYVDANHRYEFAKADLAAYIPKVRPGGLIAGDDYGVPGWWEDGVTRAVDEVIASGAADAVSLEGGQFILRTPAT